MRIIEDANMLDSYEDWSAVRSPGRARRRRWKHKQRIVTRYKPKTEAFQMGNTLVMHPELARQMRQQIAERHDDLTRQAFLGGVNFNR
jgi:hypothetical protein